MKPVRIAYVSHSIIPSMEANSIHVMKMCAALAANGHEVALLVPGRRARGMEAMADAARDPFGFYGVPETFRVVRLPFPEPKGSPARNLAALALSGGTLLARLLARRPDLVYGRDALGCWVGARLGIPTILETHYPPTPSRSNDYLHQRLLASSALKAVVCISESLRRILGQDPRFAKVPMLVAHDGADDPGPAPETRRPGPLRVGYVGSLYKGRGVELMARLAGRLQDMEFHLVGGDQDTVRALRREHQSPNLIFHGFVPPAETQALRWDMDVLAAPYERDLHVAGSDKDTSGFMSPLKIFEYMASGRAMVCTDLPVLREILDQDCAAFAPEKDEDGWARALIRLADTDFRDRLAAKARQRFLRGHTWRSRAARVLTPLNLQPDRRADH